MPSLTLVLLASLLIFIFEALREPSTVEYGGRKSIINNTLRTIIRIVDEKNNLDRLAAIN